MLGGQCLGHHEGKAVFVWNALPGEEAEVELTKNKKDFAEGTAVNIISPSFHRLAPREEHFAICSPWQIMDWEEENRWKKEICREAYVKIGGLPAESALEIVAPEGGQYHYRNKMEYSFEGVGRVSLAFFERGKRRHLAIGACELAEEGINEAARVVLDWINRQKIPVRSLKSLMLRSNNQKQVIAALFLKDEMIFADWPELNAHLLGFQLYYSDRHCPASRPDKLLYAAGQDYLIANLRGVKLKYGLLSFFQINIPVFVRAIDEISDFLEKDRSVVDYYSGVGAISLPLAGQCRDVVLVDSNREAVAYAEKNIALNNLTGKCRAELCPAEKITELISEDKIIIFDPPRAGLHEKVIEKIARERPERIIYLSCNVATQARDIKMLAECYKPVHLKLFNFFPRTPHVECLAVLDRI